MDAPFFLLDGKQPGRGANLIHPSNRSFRYGEGLFETLRCFGGKVPLWFFHRKRLQTGMERLGLQLPVHFSTDDMLEQAIELARKNKAAGNARIRLTLWRGDGGLWDEVVGPAHYSIEVWPVPLHPQLNSNGVVMGIYPDGWKSCDGFSNLKTNNYLLYAMAARYGKEQRWNDALVLNQYQRICDTTIANVFIRKGSNWYTPALTEGCVAGVMRQFLFEQPGWQISEKILATEELLQADEVILTNAFFGMRWVQQIGTKQFSCSTAPDLFRQMVQPLFS